MFKICHTISKKIDGERTSLCETETEIHTHTQRQTHIEIQIQMQRFLVPGAQPGLLLILSTAKHLLKCQCHSHSGRAATRPMRTLRPYRALKNEEQTWLDGMEWTAVESSQHTDRLCILSRLAPSWHPLGSRISPIRVRVSLPKRAASQHRTLSA